MRPPVPWMLLSLVFVIAVLFLAYLGRTSKSEQRNFHAMTGEDANWYYSQGVNDAIIAISLLSLELNIKGERKTWGEMGDVVRKRLGVSKEGSSLFERAVEGDFNIPTNKLEAK